MAEESLAGSDFIYRRILQGQYIRDENLNRMRPSSAAFEKRPGEEHASCYIDSLLRAESLQPQDVLQGHETLGLVSFTVDCLRTHDRDAQPDPEGLDPERPHVCDAAHGMLIEPQSASGKELKRGWAKFAKDACISIVQEPKASS